MDESVNLCVNCKHATARYANILFCTEPRNLIISKVDGYPEFDRSACSLRENKDKCGPTGAWFGPKEAA